MNKPAQQLNIDADGLSLRAFQSELDELFKQTRAKLGQEDVDHITKVARWSSAFEWLGRGLIFFAIDPISYALGIFSLSLHKQLETMELGHNIQHGTYENIPGADRFTRKNHWWRFYWRLSIHAPSWRHSHNHLHHGSTNVVGRDPDARLYMRVVKEAPRRWYHRFLYLEVVINWPNIIFNANAAATGLFEAYTRRPEEELEILPDRSWKSIYAAHRNAFAGSALYFLREYIIFPLIAGPLYAKVLFGNWMSSLLRNLFSAPALYAAHINPEVEIFPGDQRATSRGEWSMMQVVSTQNFEVPRLVSILVGGLDHQIEHHLFPTLPPNRLREIAPQVRGICERHGIKYNTQPWKRALKLIFVQLKNLNQTRGR